MGDDTPVVVTTDHGHDIGERGGYRKQFPHFDSHANISFMVCPVSQGKQQATEAAQTATTAGVHGDRHCFETPSARSDGMSGYGNVKSPSSDHHGGARVPFSFLQQWPV